MQQSIVLEVLNKKYVVNFPTNGQLIDIVVLRNRLSSGQYSDLEFTAPIDPLVKRAKTLIDMVSTFNVLIPQLKADVAAKSLLDLPMEGTEALLAAYSEQFLPWYQEWLEYLKAPQLNSKGNDSQQAIS